MTTTLLVVLLVWLLCSFRARNLSRLIDAWEVMILAPASLTCYVLVLFSAFHATWGRVAAFLVTGLLFGAVGAGLHRSSSARQLLDGIAKGMPKGPPEEELSHEESFDLAKAIVKTAFILGLLGLYLAWERGLRWYIAIPCAYFAAGLLAALSSVPPIALHGLRRGYLRRKSA